MIRRYALIVAVASAVALASAAPALAHIDPDPTEAQAGSRLTVGFTVEHGCDGSPTVRLDMRLPSGVGDPVPGVADGWNGSVATVDGETIVTFDGGSLADDVEGTFAVTMTLPPTPDTTIYFPFVQRCATGEIRWIGIPAEPGDDLDEPAPAMLLVGPVVTTVPVETTTSESVPATSESVPATSEVVIALADSAPASAGSDSSGGSGAGTLVFIASVAAVVALGAFVTFRSRQARAGRDDG